MPPAQLSVAPEPNNKPVNLVEIWAESEKLSRLTRWGLFQHQFVQAARALLITPVVSGLTVLTIAIALFLLSSFALLIENMQGALSKTQTELTLSIFLRADASSENVAQLKSELEAIPMIQGIELLSKDDALAKFRTELGDQAFILEGLEQDNPLPPSLEVRFRDDENASGIYSSVSERYGSHSAVEYIQYSKGLLSQIGKMLSLFRVGGGIAVLLTLLLTGFIISNTIRLAMHSRHQEIEIMKLVGATNRFVRTPFIVEGFLQGLAGGLLSLAFLYLAFSLVQDLLLRSVELQFFIPQLNFLSISSQFLVLGVGVAVGMFGSYFAARSLDEDFKADSST